jgi:hypothetical protein
MLQRAKEKDHSMMILMWLHLCAISDMFRDSEQENDAELFRSAAKLSMLLFVKTNALKYARMGIYYWVKWETASDADKLLHDSLFFTKKTVNGKTKFCDAFQERYNKDVREYLGKHAKPNQELLCIHTSLLLKERKQFCQGLATVSTSKNPSLEKTFAMSVIFLQQLDLIERWNVWGEGPVRVGEQGKEAVAAQLFSDPTGITHLNYNILFEISAGEETLMQYFEKTQLVSQPDDGITELEK